MTVRFCKTNEVKEYPRLVLIQLPQGYEPCALPMRHAGEECLLCLTSLSYDELHASDKAGELK